MAETRLWDKDGGQEGKQFCGLLGRYKSSEGYYEGMENISWWQVPFRVGASLLMYGFFLAVAAGGFLVVLSLALALIGAKDSPWPPWPF